MPTDVMVPIRKGGGTGEFIWKGQREIPTAHIEAILNYPNSKNAQSLHYHLAFTESHKRFLLVSKLDNSDKISNINKNVISEILNCIPQDKWKSVLNLLTTYKFHIDVLEIAPDDLFDDFCKKYTEYSFLNRPIAAYTDDHMPFSKYNTVFAIGSLLYKNKLLGEKSKIDDLCYSKVNVQFLKDLSDSIDYLEKNKQSFISLVTR